MLVWFDDYVCCDYLVRREVLNLDDIAYFPFKLEAKH